MTLRPPRRGFSVSRHLSERARAARDDAAREDSARKSASGDPDIAGAGGFAGMVGALRGLVEQFAAAAQQQAGEQHTGADDPAPAGSAGRNGQHEVSFGDGKARMVFGYTLRMGADGISAEPFGNTAPTSSAKRGESDAGSSPAPLLPIVEVFEDGDTVVVVAELPGADPDRIVCQLDGQYLLIDATGLRSYRKDLPLPAPVRPDGVVQSFRNGILEVRLMREVRG